MRSGAASRDSQTQGGERLPARLPLPPPFHGLSRRAAVAFLPSSLCLSPTQNDSAPWLPLTGMSLPGSARRCRPAVRQSRTYLRRAPAALPRGPPAALAPLRRRPGAGRAVLPVAGLGRAEARPRANAGISSGLSPPRGEAPAGGGEVRRGERKGGGGWRGGGEWGWRGRKKVNGGGLEV